MPTKARHAASIAAGLGGSVRIRVLTEKGYSKRQLKQMVHGPHQILVAPETKMKLTNLGRKVAAIGEAKPSSTQDWIVLGLVYQAAEADSWRSTGWTAIFPQPMAWNMQATHVWVID